MSNKKSCVKSLKYVLEYKYRKIGDKVKNIIIALGIYSLIAYHYFHFF